MDHDVRYNKVNKTRARRYGKRVLAVRAMAGETAWLDGRVVWLDGRVAWQTDRATVVPDVPTLALAQRRLAQIAAYPRSSKRAFGDASAWLAARLERLELAKKLQPISEPDIEKLVERAQARDTSAISRLVALLPAEAYCVNTLPLSPGEALVACGGKAVGPLHAMADNINSPPAGRALAALALGAIAKRNVDGGAPTMQGPDWSARAYAWAMRHGWPEDAPLVTMLLAASGGTVLAERMAKLEHGGSRFLLPTEQLRELLANGVEASRVVDICEACAAMEPVAVRIMRYRDKLEDVSLQWRREAAARLQNERLALVGDLIDLVRRYALTTLDPPLVHNLAQFAGLLLDHGNYPAEMAESLLIVLRRGLELAVEMCGPFFELLLEHFDSIWQSEKFVKAAQGGTDEVTYWRTIAYREEIYPISELLELTRDPDIVRESLANDFTWFLSRNEWKDKELYRLAMRLLRDLAMGRRYWAVSTLMYEFPTAKAARATLNPLVAAIMQERKTELRGLLAENVLETLTYAKPHIKERANKMAGHVPRLIRFIEAPGIEDYYCWRAVESSAVLDKSVGDDASLWLDRLLTYLEELGQRGELTNDHEQTLRVTLPFLVALAARDVDRFGLLLRASLAHTYDYDREAIEKGIAVLERFPSFRDALARIFPLQPHRCVGLAVKMGYVSQLGNEASAPLGYLEDHAEDEGPPDEWKSLIALVPGAEPDAQAYIRARRVLDEPAEIPPGVRKALDQPQKFAEELAFLEKRSADQNAGSGIETRIENLRARLSNEGKLMREVRAEVEEKMAQISAEAQIAAAEAKMLECYRVKLERLAGTLPPNLEINDNLVNAILLTGDIDSNRKLLVRLLKAYVKGDTRWHEHHPANVKYLAELVAKGVNVDVWLGANPKRYVCRGVSGGKVRLLLERDPLGVLQMGNYFDTCLSFGRFNSFSTVANACELNKRVIYAYDGAGRVVGRKLIGIGDKGKLVGFHTYSTLGDEEGKALRAIFRRYCETFAAQCGLELADDGTVPKLFASAWYDDGTVNWIDDKPRSSSNQESGVRG